MTSLATSADLSILLDLTFSASDTTRAELLLDMVSNEVVDFCDVDFTQTAGDTWTRPGTPERVLFLPGGPVDSVASVTIDGETVDSDTYTLYTSGAFGGQLWRDSGYGWGDSDDVLVVTYTHGYSSVPTAARNIVLGAAARLWANPERRRSIALESGYQTGFAMPSTLLDDGDRMALREAGLKKWVVR